MSDDSQRHHFHTTGLIDAAPPLLGDRFGLGSPHYTLIHPHWLPAANIYSFLIQAAECEAAGHDVLEINACIQMANLGGLDWSGQT